MKCRYCGADLDDGVLFCGECGAMVNPQKRFCRECGKEVPSNACFCSYCGADLTATPTPEELENEAPSESRGAADDKIKGDTPTPSTGPDVHTDMRSKITSFLKEIQAKLMAFWAELDSFCKVFTISSAVILVLLLIAWTSRNGTAVFISLLQITALVLSILWHKEILNCPKVWLKYAVLAVALLFSILNIISYSSKKENTPKASISTTVATENTESTIFPPCTATDCIGQSCDTVKNAFSAAGFTEVHTVEINDLPYSESDKNNTVESISVGGKNSFSKALRFNSSDVVEIRYHTYKKFSVNVDVDFIPNLFFDKYGIALYFNEEKVGELAHGEDKSFSLKAKPGTYALVFQKKGDTSRTGSLELDIKGDVNAAVQISCQSDSILVKPLYIEKLGEVHEGEIMMPQAASSYGNLNYLDVKKSLEDLGFSNISTEAFYDIYFGWTDTGAVESVTIDGNNSFNRGDVFNSDSNIIIAYHMPYSDDPSRIKVEKDTSDFTGLNYLDVEQAFKDMGFSTIELEKVVTEDTLYVEGSVVSVAINGSSFTAGTTFAPNSKVRIKYYHVEEPTKIETLTIDNSNDFASLMKITDQTDVTTIREFVNSHKGDYIEFDGCIAYMMHHKNLKTRFDICLVGGNYSDRVLGPLFAFEDVNFYDMNVSGSDTVAQGMHFRIVGQIDGFNSDGKYIVLKPISLTSR